AQAQWMDFKWAARNPHDPSAEQHAAVLLPVNLEGASCWMQFDTGIADSVLYRPMLPAKLAGDGAAASVNLSVGGMALSRQFKLMYPDDPNGRTAGCRETDGVRLVGSLGDDVFLDRAIE